VRTPRDSIPRADDDGRLGEMTRQDLHRNPRNVDVWAHRKRRPRAGSRGGSARSRAVGSPSPPGRVSDRSVQCSGDRAVVRNPANPDHGPRGPVGAGRPAPPIVRTECGRAAGFAGGSAGPRVELKWEDQRGAQTVLACRIGPRADRGVLAEAQAEHARPSRVERRCTSAASARSTRGSRDNGRQRERARRLALTGRPRRAGSTAAASAKPAGFEECRPRDLPRCARPATRRTHAAGGAIRGDRIPSASSARNVEETPIPPGPAAVRRRRSLALRRAAKRGADHDGKPLLGRGRSPNPGPRA
jgi:hypothetical protein